MRDQPPRHSAWRRVAGARPLKRLRTGSNKERFLRRYNGVEVPQVLLAAHVAQDALGVVASSVVEQHCAAVVAHGVETADLQLVEQGEQLLGNALVAVVAGLLIRLTVACEVDGQHL
jgi:hypothetical protein